MSKKRIHGNRKNAMLKVLRKNRGKSGYRVVRHMAWLWNINQYPVLLRESAQLIKKMIYLGYYFSPEELAIIHRAVRKGNSQYFDFFESGQYVPTKRDIDWVNGMIAFLTEQYTKRVAFYGNHSNQNKAAFEEVFEKEK